MRRRCAASCRPLAVLAAVTALASGAPPPDPGHRETPDQPPAARPGPGAAPTRGVVPRDARVVSGLVRTFAQVNVDARGANIPGDAANEPSIAVDPTAPHRVVIGWRQFDTVASNFRQAGVAHSRDAGRTWTNDGPLTPGFFRSDPVLAADAAGRFYYYSLSSLTSTEFFVSDDGGVSWSAPIPAFGGDKQWFVLDDCGGTGRSKVYAAWSVNAACCGDDAFIRSFDAAQTFDPPVEILETPIWGTMAVDADGRVFIGGVDPSDHARFLVARSTTAQDDRARVTWDFATEVVLGGMLEFGGGPNPGGLLGQASVAVDTSGGPHHGNVYLLCSTAFSLGSDPLDVRMARSTDGGATFEPAVKVNDDPPGVNAWQWFGTMSIAPNGRLDVIWNDTRDDPDLSVLYYANSVDGGQTFSAGVPLTAPFDHGLGYPNQPKLGDYYGMVSDRLGAHVAFAATFNGEQDVYYLRIGPYDCDGDGVPDDCAPPGDLTGDGAVTFADLLVVLRSWGPCPAPPAPCPADLDGNGVVGLPDLLIVLANWT